MSSDTKPMLASGPATNEYYPPSSATFDPAVHLAYTPPASKLTMSDIGLPSQGISPIAVTEPFSLMSVEGVRQLRKDILSTDVLEKYTVASKLAACQSREFPKTVTPFVHQVWKHPEVLRIVSEAAGIELEPVYVYCYFDVYLCTSLCPSSIRLIGARRLTFYFKLYFALFSLVAWTSSSVTSTTNSDPKGRMGFEKSAV